MHDLAVVSIPSMSETAIANVRELESLAGALPQMAIDTRHVLHAGMYARTVMIPSGTMICGVLITIPTLLVVMGDCLVYTGGDDPIHLTGYNVLSASPNRKQVFVANTDTYLTMTFPTGARTVEEAEEQFTDEAHLLLSRRT
jgi:hypothetical protein